MLFLKSNKSTGLFDPGKNLATIHGKEYRIPANLVVSAGDVLEIRGEKFTAFHPDPSNFGEFAARTAQIIQPWDAAAIIHYCNISPGHRVLESGVGSGALSAAILNAIGKEGHLTTVEMDNRNIENARGNLQLISEFRNWELVNSRIGDFASADKFNSIVLDIPEPWEVVGKLSKNLINGGKICCYSPTFNQTEKSVAALKKNGYLVTESMEIIKRGLLVRENATRPDNGIIGHTAFMTFAVKLSGRSTRA